MPSTITPVAPKPSARPQSSAGAVKPAVSASASARGAVKPAESAAPAIARDAVQLGRRPAPPREPVARGAEPHPFELGGAGIIGALLGGGLLLAAYGSLVVPLLSPLAAGCLSLLAIPGLMAAGGYLGMSALRHWENPLVRYPAYGAMGVFGLALATASPGLGLLIGAGAVAAIAHDASS